MRPLARPIAATAPAPASADPDPARARTLSAASDLREDCPGTEPAARQVGKAPAGRGGDGRVGAAQQRAASRQPPAKGGGTLGAVLPPGPDGNGGRIRTPDGDGPGATSRPAPDTGATDAVATSTHATCAG